MPVWTNFEEILWSQWYYSLNTNLMLKYIIWYQLSTVGACVAEPPNCIRSRSLHQKLDLIGLC